jgi:Ca-activated chloride channel homolog
VTFSNPAWLAGGALACLALLWLWRRYDARQHAALARFVSAHLRTQLTQSVSIGRRRLQRGLLLTALALLFVALAGPLVGFRWEQVSRRGIEIIFAVDTSRSMSTPDVRPDRLTRAKLAIDDFTNRLGGDGVGLVAFAGEAYLVCPVTLDYGAFHESLNSIDINTIGRGGTNIASAIRESQAALRRRPSNDKILILVTDGEDLEGDALIAAQAAAQQDGLKIYTVGVGSAQGDLIPLSANPNAGFVKDESGAFVRSRLDEPALKAIAAATGAQYAPLGPEGQGLESIYQRSLAPLLKHDLASRQQRVYIQRYQWPLSGALALLLLSMLIGTRAGRARRPAPAPVPDSRLRGARRNAVDPAAASLLLLALPLVPAGPAHASTGSAQSAYDRGDFAAAAQAYAAAAQHDPKQPLLQFNAGAAAYRAGQFPQAAQAFQSSINHAVSGDPRQLAAQEDAYYNLGNTLYRSGQQTAQSSPQQTLDTWAKAVKAYDTALELRADDADSKYNRDFVKRKINELKQQQNQNPPQNQQNPKNQQNPQNQPNSQNQNQPPQSGAPPGQQPPNQPPPQGQPPPSQQPPGQQPPGQQPPPSAGQPPPGQQPPGQQPPGQQPPPSAGQPPPGQPPPGQPKPAPGNPDPQSQQGGDADDQHVPGEMSREEARQLLDSEKGDERHALGVPLAQRQPNAPPEKPIKDW